MQISSATPDDIPSVLRFWKLATLETSTTDDELGVADLLARDPDSLLLAENDGRIVGTLIATWDGWRGHLHRLAVDPEARRRGIAGALLAEGERRLRSLGARKIQAVVLADNTTGRAFWDAVGYRWDDRTVRHTKTFDLA